MLWGFLLGNMLTIDYDHFILIRINGKYFMCQYSLYLLIFVIISVCNVNTILYLVYC